MRPMPYRVETATGDVMDVNFPLHADTASAMRVQQLLSAVLEAVDKDISVCGETANGDVLQALAMALAVRARMIHAPGDMTGKMARDLLVMATDAAAEAERISPETGTA